MGYELRAQCLTRLTCILSLRLFSKLLCSEAEANSLLFCMCSQNLHLVGLSASLFYDLCMCVRVCLRPQCSSELKWVSFLKLESSRRIKIEALLSERQRERRTHKKRQKMNEKREIGRRLMMSKKGRHKCLVHFGSICGCVNERTKKNI